MNVLVVAFRQQVSLSKILVTMFEDARRSPSFAKTLVNVQKLVNAHF